MGHHVLATTNDRRTCDVLVSLAQADFTSVQCWESRYGPERYTITVDTDEFERWAAT